MTRNWTPDPKAFNARWQILADYDLFADGHLSEDGQAIVFDGPVPDPVDYARITLYDRKKDRAVERQGPEPWTAAAVRQAFSIRTDGQGKDTPETFNARYVFWGCHQGSGSLTLTEDGFRYRSDDAGYTVSLEDINTLWLTVSDRETGRETGRFDSDLDDDGDLTPDLVEKVIWQLTSR